jgi:ribosome assembly protein 1
MQHEKEALDRLRRNPSYQRNFCILAHVDHGKTTLSDCLLSSNGIISAKLAGRVRYLDSTEEEQARGITMKSSAIALLHLDEPARELRTSSSSSQQSQQQPPSPLSATAADTVPTSANDKLVPYLINLIDSPGHVDFSVDVATAARLCDGALVVVDAVEGVCIQTHAVLKTAWSEGVRPALVLNKLDRLITELQLSPVEAYSHLRRIIEQANVILASLHMAEKMEMIGKAAAEQEAAAAAAEKALSSSTTSGEVESEVTSSSTSPQGTLFDDESENSTYFFDPSRGNVVFASAYDGWAFTLDDFAKLHASRLNLPRALLRRALWGDYYYKPKAGKIVTGGTVAVAAKGRNMAVSLMLEPLFAAYDSCILNPNEDRVSKIVSSLNLESRLNKRDMAGKDGKLKLQAVMRAWLPLSAAVLGMVIRALPSPIEAQKNRVERLWPAIKRSLSSSTSMVADKSSLKEEASDIKLEQMLSQVRRGIETCDTSEDAAVVVFVSKMFAVPKESLPDMNPAFKSSAKATTTSSTPIAEDLNVSSSRQTLSRPGGTDQPSVISLAARAALEILPVPPPLNHSAFPEELLQPSSNAWEGITSSFIDVSPVTSPEKRLALSTSSQNESISRQQQQQQQSQLLQSSSTTSSSSSSSSLALSNSASAVLLGAEDANAVETFVAFARVFSGVLRPDKPVFVLGPRYDPLRPDADSCSHVSQVTRTLPLYMMMGRDLAPLAAAYAGNICGIGRLGAHILKTATLCSTPACSPLSGMTFQTTPLVRVCIEPVRPQDLDAVERGLALLNQADPCVEVNVADNGELQLSALGELHLQRCVKDLTQRFARCEVKVSPPINSFMETLIEAAPIVTAPTSAFPALPDSSMSSFSSSSSITHGDSDFSANSSNNSSNYTQQQTVLAHPSGSGIHFPISWTVSESAAVAFHPPSGATYSTSADRLVSLKVRAVPLPHRVTRFLQSPSAQNAIRALLAMESRETAAAASVASVASKSDENSASLADGGVGGESSVIGPVVTFAKGLQSLLDEMGDDWKNVFGKIICFGPKGNGPNLLVCNADRLTLSPNGAQGLFKVNPPTNSTQGVLASAWDIARLASTLGLVGTVGSSRVKTSNSDASSINAHGISSAVTALRSAIPQGFQLATVFGPLCNEPVMGVCFFIDAINVRVSSSSSIESLSSVSGESNSSSLSVPVPVLSSGPIISAARDACRVSLESGSLRLVEAVYACEVQCSGGKGGGGEQLGKCYAVLSKRRAKVLSEDIIEGTEIWVIKATLPLVESYGFADDLRKKTQGAASSSLLFDSWTILHVDPFFVPTTDTEREEFGDIVHEGQGRNLARVYIDAVRVRKGLAVAKKIVSDGEKQRNLSRKK